MRETSFCVLYQAVVSEILIHTSRYHDDFLNADNPYVQQMVSYIWASTRENLSSGVCEQHRRRPACASVQSDQQLCYSRFEKYHI